MCRILKIIAATFVLLCVLAVFIAPSLDLPDTAMRGRQAWAAVLFAAGAMLLCAWLTILFTEKTGLVTPLFVFDPDRARSQLTC